MTTFPFWMEQTDDGIPTNIGTSQHTKEFHVKEPSSTTENDTSGPSAQACSTPQAASFHIWDDPSTLPLLSSPCQGDQKPQSVDECNQRMLQQLLAHSAPLSHVQKKDVADIKPSLKPSQGKPSERSAKERLSMMEATEFLIQSGDFMRFNGLLWHFDGLIYRPCFFESFLNYIRRHMPSHEQKLHGIRSLQDIFTYLSCCQELQWEESTERQFVGAFENGVFDFSAGTHHEYSRNSKIFCKVNACFSPDDYTPSEIFHCFLNDISGGDSTIELLVKQLIGCLCLVPNRHLKRFYVLAGVANSGKSQIGGFIKRLYGSDLVSSIPLQDFNKQFAPSDIIGKAMVVSMDLPGSPLSERAVSTIKMITGAEDTILLEKKYAAPVNYTPRLHLLFGTNHCIRIQSDDPAFWERLVIVPFLYETPYEARDPHLLSKLWNDRDDIVTECVQTYLAIPAFVRAQQAEGMLEQHEGNPSSVDQFIQQCCYISQEARTYTQELFAAYEMFCAEHALPPVSSINFTRIAKRCYPLRSHRWRVGLSTNQNGLIGIGLL